MAATGVRVVFFGSHKYPSYVIETCGIPRKDELKEGEILVKMLLSTICSVDIENIDGTRDLNTPCILGHEGVGEVLSFRMEEEFPLCVGDRVVFSMADEEACTKCVGSFASHRVLRCASSVVRVPSQVSNAAACPANCALATMVHATSLLAKQCKVAVIQGANLLGLYGCALLHEAHFHKVYCHDVSSDRLLLVPKFGGIPILVRGEYDSSYGKEMEEGLADVVIDVCGSWDVVPYALRALRHQGTYLIVGTSHTSVIDIDTVLKKCLTVQGIQGYKAIHLEEAMDFLSKTMTKYPYESLISSPVPLQDFHSAVNMARSKRYYRTAVRP